MTFSPEVWGDVLRRLQDDIPDFAFHAWIAPLAVKATDDRLLVGCPTAFHRDRVRRLYADEIRDGWRAAQAEAGRETPAPIELVTMKEFEVAPGRAIEVRLPERRTGTGDPPTRSLATTGGARGATPSAAAHGAAAAATRLDPEPGRPDPKAGRRPRTPLLRALPDQVRPAPASPRRPPAARRPAGAEASAQPDLPFSFDSFVVGPCNALAREAAVALARRRQRSLNQLYLGGASGNGKTHLARAAAAEARRLGLSPAQPAGRPGVGVLYTSAEAFTSDFVSAMRQNRSEAWKQRYRGPIGMLIVEDIQFLSGREKTQLELFHTLQHVLDAGGSVLLTGDRTPRELVGLDPRIREQVGRGFVAELEMPDAIVRRHILRAKAAAGGVHLPPDCLELLVASTVGSVRDVESVLVQVVTTASLLGRPIDLELTRDAIELKSGESSVLPPRSITPAEIVRIVAAFFGRRPEALASRSRRRDVLVPRQLAMYLAHRYTDAPLSEIGRALGRDHPAVRNAIQRIERQVLESAPLRYQVEALSERIDERLQLDRR
jgi:chromosomal replication initiator protein